MTSLTYPSMSLPAMAFQYQYDNLSRLTGMQQTTCTWVSGGACGSWGSPSTVASATYNAAGQITNMTYDIFTETRSYNTLMQLTQETATAYFGTFTAKNMSYAYSSTQNNGRIISSTDGVTCETISYAYDALNRLITAQGSPGGFSESYTYDGFGNMGSGFSYLTNRTSTQSADANGNSTAGGYTWDMENRLISASASTWYAYDPHGKRVFTETSSTTTSCELDFYSIGGQKLAAFPCGYDQNGIFSTQTPKYNVYYGGKLIRSNNVTVVTDRLGSVRGTSNSEVMRYTPYGTERTSTSDGREKWGTYFRDSGTGNDYADQRYKAIGQAAFLSPDPGGLTTANLANPGSWNRYAYTYGDPVNLIDPGGLYGCGPALCPSQYEGNPASVDPTQLCLAMLGGQAYQWQFSNPDAAGYASAQQACQNATYTSNFATSSDQSGGGGKSRLNTAALITGAQNLLAKTRCASFVLNAIQKGFLEENEVSSPDQLAAYQLEIYDSLTAVSVIQALQGATFVDAGAPPNATEGNPPQSYTVFAQANFVSGGGSSIDFYSPFFNLGTTGQAQTTLHEGMHLIWGISDLQFAQAVGVYKNGMGPNAASAAWNKALDKNCK